MSMSVVKFNSFSSDTFKFPVHNENNVSFIDHPIIGGILSQVDYSWMAKGSHLEVVNNRNGFKVGAWTFGLNLEDPARKIVCVSEVHRANGHLPLLAIGVNSYFNGILCLFDFITSKVVRAIKFNEKITSLHIVDSGKDIFTLPSPLRNFDGIAAVGTEGGEIYLLDICHQICDESLTTFWVNEIRDELNPCEILIITSKDFPHIEEKKEVAIRNSFHLAIHLNVILESPTRHFVLKGPKGDDRIHVNKEEVTVSSLYYCPALGSILVGYNFGALQLYNLMDLSLVYTSPVCEEHIPISHFAFQEPADDPRAFCYIWTVYSGIDQYQETLPLAVMYAFCYKSKEYHEGYGFIYEDFQYASVHYQMELGVLTDKKLRNNPKGGYCIALKSIHKGTTNRDGPVNDSLDDNLTLCTFAWTVWLNEVKYETFFSIFDLNQWYKEQMPKVPNSKQNSNYLLQCCISDIINITTNNTKEILNICLNEKTLDQFIGSQRLEEHFYPNSLSFDLYCLRQTDIVYIKNNSAQKALLLHLETSGPLCLLDPDPIYQQLISLGLVPLFCDLPNDITKKQKREIILNTAIEYQLINWLCKCAIEWANGSFISVGCSIDLLILWAYQRAIILKRNFDINSIILFDYSERKLDKNTLLLLNNCVKQINNIKTFYSFVLNKLKYFIVNLNIIMEQYKSIQMVSIYLEVIQWLLNIGLLPELPLNSYPRNDDKDRIYAPYPADILTEFYNQKRALMKIENEKQFQGKDSILFIDNLIEIECGGKELQEQWVKDGGNGLYPPPSLQALLKTYLVENVDISKKHWVTIYMFLDLAMALDQERYKSIITYLIKFPAVFKVCSSFIKIIQAFWQLDHGDCNTAMGLLLDPLVLSEDIKQWQHKVALKSLILQNQQKLALLYLQVRKPAVLDDEDIILAITLYITNHMLDEAFYFENNYNPKSNTKFLNHLFNECNKNNLLKPVVYHCMSHGEETTLLRYLKECENQKKEDYQIFYHILKSNFYEILELYENLTKNHLENKGLYGQETSMPREKIIYSFKKLLPDFITKILDLCRKEKNHLWQHDDKPTPMSQFFYNKEEHSQYKTTLRAALAKAKQTFIDKPNDSIFHTENTPFLRTPLAVVPNKKTPITIIQPIEEIDEDGGELDEPSPKKRKLTRTDDGGVGSILVTPIVPRKVQTTPTSDREKFHIGTPHSILKVRAEDTKRGYEDSFAEFEKTEYTPVNNEKSGLQLKGRKSLSHRSTSSVRFKDSKVDSLNNTDKSQNSTKDSVQNSEEDVFYSPENSFESQKVDKEKTEEKEEHLIGPVTPKARRSLKRVLNKEIKATPKVKEEKKETNEQITKTATPKSRRSLKETPEIQSPVKSTLELSSPEVSIQKSELEQSEESPSRRTRLSARRSLHRQVLEANSLNRVIQTITEETKIREEIIEKKTVTQEVEDSIERFPSPQSLLEETQQEKEESLDRAASPVEDMITEESPEEEKPPETTTEEEQISDQPMNLVMERDIKEQTTVVEENTINILDSDEEIEEMFNQKESIEVTVDLNNAGLDLTQEITIETDNQRDTFIDYLIEESRVSMSGTKEQDNNEDVNLIYDDLSNTNYKETIEDDIGMDLSVRIDEDNVLERNVFIEERKSPNSEIIEIGSSSDEEMANKNFSSGDESDTEEEESRESSESDSSKSSKSSESDSKDSEKSNEEEDLENKGIEEKKSQNIDVAEAEEPRESNEEEQETANKFEVTEDSLNDTWVPKTVENKKDNDEKKSEGTVHDADDDDNEAWVPKRLLDSEEEEEYNEESTWCPMQLSTIYESVEDLTESAKKMSNEEEENEEIGKTVEEVKAAEAFKEIIVEATITAAKEANKEEEEEEDNGTSEDQMAEITEATIRESTEKLINKKKDSSVERDTINKLEIPKLDILNCTIENTPGKRILRTRHLSVDIETKPKPRRRSLSLDQPTSSPKISKAKKSEDLLESVPEEPRPIRTRLRTRSTASNHDESVTELVAELKGSSTKKKAPLRRRKSSKTEDESHEEEKLNKNKEDSKKEKKTPKTPKTNTENYVTSRRVTRGQKNLLEKTIEMEINNSSVGDGDGKKNNKSKMKPVVILDRIVCDVSKLDVTKDTIKNNIEEQQSQRILRNTRSSSLSTNVSDVSSTKTKSTTTTTTKRRTRSASVDEVSTKAETPPPLKRSKKTTKETTSTKGGSRRAKSVPVETPEKSEAKKKPSRSKRTASVSKSLPKIPETDDENSKKISRTKSKKQN